MTQEEFLVQIEPKENEAGLFEYKINGITIYRIVRRNLIEKKLRSMGMDVMNRRQGVKNGIEAIKNTLLSAWQILRLLISKRSASTVFLSFPRMDKVGNYYLDKFIDPLVSLCFENNNDFVILEQARGGSIAKPRIHENHCVQVGWIMVYSHVYARFFSRKFYKSNQACLDSFCEAVYSVLDFNPEMITDLKKEIIYILCCTFKQISYYKYLFQHLKCKRIIGPSRNYIRKYIVSAHLVGAKAYELQHGIVDGIRIDNSGFQPKECTPDYYLAYGENDSGNYHGIDSDKIVTIGWAFGEYVSSVQGFVQYQEQDVLVISDPTITDIIIGVTLQLAKANPESHFYVRPHPHEEVSESQRNRLESQPNAHWQDRRINISMVMKGFTHVIGENSSVVYEALAAGRKVGRLCYEGFYPRYLKSDDRECFWEIKDQESFERFLNEDITTKKTRSIYSPFDKELFLHTIGIK